MILVLYCGFLQEMVKLCLMASQPYLPAVLFHPLSKECQPLLPSLESRRDATSSGSLNMRLTQSEDMWKPISRFLDGNQFGKIDPTIGRPVLIDVKGTSPNTILFSVGIAKQSTRHEEISNFLMSGSSEVEKGGVDLSIPSDLMDLQPMTIDMSREPYAPDSISSFHYAESQPSLIYPSCDFYSQKVLFDYMGDLAHRLEVRVDLDGQVSFTGPGTDMKDILSIIAEFYLSKDSTKWRKQPMLVPHFDRMDFRKARANVHRSSLKLEAVTVLPLKSPGKIKHKPSPKKKSSNKAVRETDLYKNNYFHACESLLSIMVDKKRNEKTAVLELKKSGPELRQLLTQFSASIAGTGIAVLFSVLCKVATGRVPFCSSKLLNTGLGIGLVWLSWAVNRLRDTIVNIIKNSGKLGLKEKEMMKNLDSSVSEIYFRAVTLMAVLVLRLA